MLTPVQDQTSPDSESVKAFLDAQNLETSPAIKPEAGAGAASTASAPAQDQGDVEIHLSADKSLSTPVQEEELKNVFVTVRDVDIPVTTEDQALYLKAVMNDKPVILEVQLANGMTVRVRSLTAYEGDLVTIAAENYMREYTDGHLETALMTMQGARVVMQVEAVNNIPFDNVHFKFTAGETDRKKDVKNLIEAMSAAQSDMSVFRYGLLVRAVNIFEHKMNRLNELALNRDFWVPAG